MYWDNQLNDEKQLERDLCIINRGKNINSETDSLTFIVRYIHIVVDVICILTITICMRVREMPIFTHILGIIYVDNNDIFKH